jgi:Ca-activated chloride channel family protein
MTTALPILLEDPSENVAPQSKPARSSDGNQEVPSRQAAPAASDPDAGFGALSTERGCLPLAALDVQARLDGLVARVALTQTFVNPHDVPLEATYIFPLPDRAALTRFRLEVTGRVVEGELKERGAARRDYDQAIQAGQRAAITEEERPGVFTLRVGNLPPGEEATVHLTLTGPLTYSNGEATFRFPLVVAPRYVPGAPLPGSSVGDGVTPDTDAVPDASRISPPVLLPGFPNPVRLGLSIDVAPSSLAPRDFRSSLHTILESESDSVRRFRLMPGERLNRDFILRFRVGAESIATSLVVQPDRGESEEGTFLLTLVPPVGDSAPRPRDVVFVLDRSGSMSGWKMVAARRALARMVDTLTERDRFAVLAFDTAIETPPDLDGPRLVSATDRRRFRAVEFLAKVEARGGTEMAQPLDLAVGELANSGEGRERILVLVTDGQVGNEDQMLRQLGPRLRGLRVFTLGIDQAVNAAFLRRLADLGGGHAEMVESEDRLDAVMDQIHRHIGTPVLAGLRLESAGLAFVAGSLVPGRLPDLFAGTPLLLFGRYRGEPRGDLVVQARDGAGRAWQVRVEPRRDDAVPLASLWARGRLRELEDRYAIGGSNRASLEKEILATSLRFGVLCRFTAFVAVDRSEVVNPGGQLHSIVQPVEQPAGWAPMAPAPQASLLCHFASPLRDRCVSRAGPATPPPLASSIFASRRLASAPEGPAKMEDITRTGAQSPRPGVPPVDNEDEDLDLLDDDFDEGDGEDSGSGAVHLDAESIVELDDLDEEEPARKKRRRPRSRSRTNQRSLLQRLLGFFRGDRKEKAAAAVDRSPYRQRVADLLRELQAAPAGDPTARFAVLRSLLGRMEELFRDLVSAGDRHASVEQLGQALLQLKPLLAQAPPPENAVLAIAMDIERALRDWLALTAAESPREGFWK